MNSQFDYYYGGEAEQFSFLRIPKILIKEDIYKSLSDSAKILYSLMLDRMSLSIKNGWVDSQNRVFIIYLCADIEEDLNCGNKKVSRLVGELTDIGLIEKKRRGQGRPDLIYVKNFVQKKDLSSFRGEEISNMESDESIDISENTDMTFQEVSKRHFKKCQNDISRSVKTTFQEVSKRHSKKCQNDTQNNTDINNTNMSNINQSIYQSIYNTTEQLETDEDRIDGFNMSDDTPDNITSEEILENLEYDLHMQNDPPADKELYAELCNLVCETICCESDTLTIGGRKYSYNRVREKFLRLNSTHIEYVIDAMQRQHSRIHNIKAYMLTALYNAPDTINHYFQAAVQADFAGG